MKNHYRFVGLNPLFGIVIVLLCLSQTSYADTFYSNYGTSRTHNIAATIGTHSFQVDGIARNKWTEWYVNDVYTGESENDYSGYWIDPEYTRYISGTIKIEAKVYNSDWTVYEEYHIWNVSIARPDLIDFHFTIITNSWSISYDHSDSEESGECRCRQILSQILH